jgi:hypothetical protein
MYWLCGAGAVLEAGGEALHLMPVPAVRMDKQYAGQQFHSASFLNPCPLHAAVQVAAAGSGTPTAAAPSPKPQPAKPAASERAEAKAAAKAEPKAAAKGADKGAAKAGKGGKAAESAPASAILQEQAGYVKLFTGGWVVGLGWSGSCRKGCRLSTGVGGSGTREAAAAAGRAIDLCQSMYSCCLAELLTFSGANLHWRMPCDPCTHLCNSVPVLQPPHPAAPRTQATHSPAVSPSMPPGAPAGHWVPRSQLFTAGDKRVGAVSAEEEEGDYEVERIVDWWAKGKAKWWVAGAGQGTGQGDSVWL